MRIATLGNASVIHTRRWVEHFRRRGHDVALWSVEPAPASLEARVLHTLPLPGFLRYPSAVPGLRRELDAFRPDIVDAHYVPNYGVMGVLSARHPLSVTAWGSDLLVAGPRNALQRARARWVLERADLVLADSDNLADAARDLGGARARVEAIPWGVDVDRFRPAPERDAGLLLSTRMHEPVYDLPTLFRGLAPLMRERADLRLIVTGDGTLHEALRDEAHRLLPADRVEFVGRVDVATMAELLSRANLYLSASLSDSTSVSLLEAMASGAVPVVSDIDGNREWVAHGEGARLFAPGDAEAVTRAARDALDPVWAASARKLNQDVIRERGDWNVNMAKIESLFEGLVARAAGG